jgi:hypothetical protein
MKYHQEHCGDLTDVEVVCCVYKTRCTQGTVSDTRDRGQPACHEDLKK